MGWLILCYFFSLGFFSLVFFSLVFFSLGFFGLGFFGLGFFGLLRELLFLQHFAAVDDDEAFVVGCYALA